MRVALLGWRGVLALLVSVLVIMPPAGVAAGDASTAADPGTATRLTLRERGSPFWPDGDRRREKVTLRLAIDRPAHVRLRIEDFDGRRVRSLLDGPRVAGSFSRRWDGRNDAGKRLPSGPYRAVATADDGRESTEAEVWVTLAQSGLYPRRPGFITIAVDPGHGGALPGAVARDGTREADLNLDISLRLAAMLRGAGVNVVMTRTTDTDVNVPLVDRTLDGVVDYTDELAARPDVANPARADLFVAVHNNTAANRSVGGPSAFYWADRPYGGRSARLARLIQAEMLAKLRRFRSATWEPYDHGALVYPYYVLRDYDPPRLLRPTQMPAVLSEGLFLSNPREISLLKQRRVRAAMAEAYYEAMARYLRGRTSHVGYGLLDGPDVAQPDERATFEVEVRNGGTTAMRGWTLHAAAIPAPYLYDGRGRRGRPMGKVRIPPLKPGARARVSMRVRTPTMERDWLVLFDARDDRGRRASRIGSPPLQHPLSTLVPPPSAQMPRPARWCPRLALPRRSTFRRSTPPALVGTPE